MTNASWDNGGGPPERKGMGTGMKVLVGCGAAVLLLAVTCGVAGVVLGRMIKKDPAAFEKRVEGWAKGMVQKDWGRMRTLVDQLQTDAGAGAVYQANAGLQEAYATEALFLKAVQGWRPHLTPLPEEPPMGGHGRHRRDRGESAPEPNQGMDVSVNKMFGHTTIRCRYPDGGRLSVTFDGEKLSRLEWH
jgi:hypothetical protein